MRSNSPRVGVTNNGVQTVQARAGNFNQAPAATAMTASAAVAAPAAVSNQAPTVQAGDANMATYNQLVNLYNQADDATKLKFFKYIMSN